MPTCLRPIAASLETGFVTIATQRSRPTQTFRFPRLLGMLNGGSRHPSFFKVAVPETTTSEHRYTNPFLTTKQTQRDRNLSAKNLKIWDWNWFRPRRLWKWSLWKKL